MHEPPWPIEHINNNLYLCFDRFPDCYAGVYNVANAMFYCFAYHLAL